MIMFSERVIIKGVNMYTINNNQVVQEHKRNINILQGVLCRIDIKRVKYHMIKLNRYNKHIRFKLFVNLSVIRCYGLNNIQLRVLYNNLLFNGHIK
jgi:hypothetical protein